MYTIATYRKRANAMGLRLSKGYGRNPQTGEFIRKGVTGEKVIGYELITLSPNAAKKPFYSYSMELEEVDEELRFLYKSYGMKW